MAVKVNQKVNQGTRRKEITLIINNIQTLEYASGGKVVAMEAVGHTPGHTVFQVGKLLIIGDLIHGAALQLEHPEICATYDMDKQEAIKTRKNLLQYARENGLVIAGMHLPVPAFIK